MALTVVDAGVLIGFLDASDAHHAAARRALAEAGERGDSLVLPASALAECLVAPARRGDEAVETVRAFIARVPVDVAPLDAATAEAAARVRARHGARVRLPDALVIATAQALDADTLLTTHHGWPARSTLRLRAQIVRL